MWKSNFGHPTLRLRDGVILLTDLFPHSSDPIVADAVTGLLVTSDNSTNPSQLDDADAPLDRDLEEDARVPRGPGPLRAQRVEPDEAAPVIRLSDRRLRRPAAHALEGAPSRLDLAPGPFPFHGGPAPRRVRREIGVGRQHTLEVRGRARFARKPVWKSTSETDDRRGSYDSAV